MPVVYIFNWLSFLQEATDAIALIMVFPGITPLHSPLTLSFTAVVALSFSVALPFFLFVEAPIGRLVTSWDNYGRNFQVRHSLLHSQ